MADGTSMQRSQDRNLQGDRCSGYSDATNQCFWRGPRLGVCNWGLWIQKNFGSSHLGFWSSGTCFFQASKETVCLVNCGGFQNRAFVIYDGIHYDVLVRRGPSGPGTWNLADVEWCRYGCWGEQKLFETTDQGMLEEAIKVAKVRCVSLGVERMRLNICFCQPKERSIMWYNYLDHATHGRYGLLVSLDNFSIFLVVRAFRFQLSLAGDLKFDVIPRRNLSYW